MKSITKIASLIMTRYYCVVLFSIISNSTLLYSQEIPQIISQKDVSSQNFLPDFSYAGYHFGNIKIRKINLE